MKRYHVGKDIAKVLLALCIVVGAVMPVLMWYYWQVPANVEYNTLFGSSVTMATSGAASLTGPGSIQDYVMAVWTQMNQTFAGYNFATTYNNPWPWGRTPDNTLAKQNEYFRSLNQTITQQQEWLNEINAGKISVTTSNPIMTAINVTRNEMQATGCLDWALAGAWYLHYAPLAYWTFYYTIILLVIFAVLAILLGVYIFRYQEYHYEHS